MSVLTESKQAGVRAVGPAAQTAGDASQRRMLTRFQPRGPVSPLRGRRQRLPKPCWGLPVRGRGLQRNPPSPPLLPEACGQNATAHTAARLGGLRGQRSPRHPPAPLPSPGARLAGQVGPASPAARGHRVLSRPARWVIRLKACQPCPASPPMGSRLQGARPGPHGGDLGSTATTALVGDSHTIQSRGPTG